MKTGAHMKNHALRHHPFVVRHGPDRRRAAGAFEFCAEHFLLFPIGAVLALVWANVEPQTYFMFAQSFGFLVNEVGMAFFFALIGQEIVEAVMVGGALHSWRRWGLPIVAAAGGILGSVVAFRGYISVSNQLVLAQAWPVACAIDIAVAYYVLKWIYRRTPILPFVLLLGIATNVFGMIIVALQGPPLETRTAGIVLVLVAVGFALLSRARKAPTFWPYLALCGTTCWWAFYWIGLHPALAFLPLVPLLPREPRSLDLFESPPDDDPVHHFEHEWNHLVQLVLFFFGLVNAGVVLGEWDTGTWALLTAALVGRPAGVMLAIALAVAAGLHLPRRVHWRELTVMALATSSGFMFALVYTAELIPLGPVRDQMTIAALVTIAGAAITFAVARLLRAGRFAPRIAMPHASHPPVTTVEAEAPWDSV
jgi:Na+:H+ antiporter, NhaA family